MLEGSERKIATIADYLTVSAAARLLGVSASTLRNWDRSGKLKAARHPLNKYRLYRRDDLEALLKKVAPNDADS